MAFRMKIISTGQAIPEIKKLLLSTNPSDVQSAYNMIRGQNRQTLMKLELDDELHTYNTAIYEAREIIKKKLSELNG